MRALCDVSKTKELKKRHEAQERIVTAVLEAVRSVRAGLLAVPYQILDLRPGTPPEHPRSRVGSDA